MTTAGGAPALQKPIIAVFGSLNLDRIRKVRQLPRPGETIACTSSTEGFGGKGANQAVAAAHAGGSVLLCGALGDDEAGRSYRRHLQQVGVTLKEPRPAPQSPTGEAIVLVEDSGENLIITQSGANQMWNSQTTSTLLSEVIPMADLLVLQMEIPIESVVQAVSEAARLNVKCLLNPSPYHSNFPWGLHPIHTVIVNEGECASLLEQDATAFAQLTPTQRSQTLAILQIENLVVTRGPNPALYFNQEKNVSIPTFPVEAIDTVGAGDTFAGNLAVEIIRGMPMELAIKRASAAAALATLGKGAQSAMPKREQVDSVLLSLHG